jgi:NAD(P)H dehydrogenase (quinone)
MAGRTSPTFFVTGAAGHFGRRVTELLLDAAAGTVIAGTRSPARIADLAARGARARPADFDDPASLETALAGVDKLLIVSTDSLAVPGERRRQHLAAVAAAVRAGVREILYTSMPRPEPPSAVSFAPDHWATEQAIEQSGARWTMLRNNWYAENLRHVIPAALASGKWYTAAGDGRIAYVTREDTARAAAAAMLRESSNIRYDITGPAAVTQGEVAALVADAFERPIDLVHVTEEQQLAGLLAAGVPGAMARLSVEFDRNTREGKLATVTDAVEQLTGRRPQAVREWLYPEAAVAARALPA